MTLTTDEKRALSFIAFLVFLSAALRLAAMPEPVAPPAGGGLDLATHIEATRAAVAAEERLSTPLAEGERLDPNVASAAELQRLPRVGPALAGRIVEERGRNGRYRSLEELARVPGIGDRMLELLAPHVDLPRRPAVAAGSGTRGTGAGPAVRSAAGGSAASPSGASERVDLNTADETALAGLSGIGPVLAGRIVAYRDSVGGFEAVEELARVKGIGPATLERIRDRVRVYR